MNVPQDVAGVQLQVTPREAESFATTAETFAAAPAAIVAGGAVENVTERGCGVGLGPELGELPPPQPERAAITSMERISEVLIISPWLSSWIGNGFLCFKYHSETSGYGIALI